MVDTKMKVETSHLVIGAAVLIIILIVGWMVFSRSRVSSAAVSGTENNASGSTSTSTSTPNDTSGMRLVVDDQAAGESVQIRAMEITSESWIAVREVGTGRVLGAGRFPAGATSGTVSLLRASVPGGKYEAIVYLDEGDKIFDMKVDDLINSVVVPFSAQ